jgi:hypothetical protein
MCEAAVTNICVASLTGVTIGPQTFVRLPTRQANSDSQSRCGRWNDGLGLRVWCVMGIEALNNAARAAGFAMAACDEPHEEVRVDSRPAEAQWRAGEAVLPHEPSAPAGVRAGDWMRSLFGLFGRRAPASSL